MCLIKKSYIPRITLKDKVVYKLVRHTRFDDDYKYQTLIQNYPFNIGDVIKPQESFLKTFFRNTINGEAVHAYKTKNEILTMIYPRLNVWVKCIIPRGSLYWLGDDDDIAASKIKIIEEIN